MNIIDKVKEIESIILELKNRLQVIDSEQGSDNVDFEAMMIMTHLMREKLVTLREMKRVMPKMAIPSEEIFVRDFNDIREWISLNDKLLYIRELFNGDHDQYRLSVERINQTNSYDEATGYLKDAFPEWDENSNCVNDFMMIVKRRFQ